MNKSKKTIALTLVMSLVLSLCICTGSVMAKNYGKYTGQWQIDGNDEVAVLKISKLTKKKVKGSLLSERMAGAKDSFKFNKKIKIKKNKFTIKVKTKKGKKLTFIFKLGKIKKAENSMIAGIKIKLKNKKKVKVPWEKFTYGWIDFYKI